MTLKKYSKNIPDKKLVKRLYLTAFPAAERAPYFLMERRARQNRGDFYIAYDHDSFAGMTYVIAGEDTAYVFYLAVDENSRGKGYGSAILSELKNVYNDKTLFLAIEDPDEPADNTAQRLTRKRFYENNGFHLIDCKLREANMVYAVMAAGDNVTPEKYNRLIADWAGKIIMRLVKMEMF